MENKEESLIIDEFVNNINSKYLKRIKKVHNKPTKKEFFEIIKTLLEHDSIKRLKTYQHHYNSTIYSHSIRVAYLSYAYCKRRNLDYVAAAKARTSS